MSPANTRIEAQIIRSRSIGSQVGTLIGAGWMVYGLHSFPNVIRVPLGLVGLVIVVFLWFRSWRLIATSRRMPAPDAVAKTANRHVWRWFWLNFLLEVVLLNVAVNLLAAPPLHIYWIAAISFVVGLHFLPMAKFFEVPSFLACGGAMMVLAAAAAACLYWEVAPPPVVIACEAIANAITLWATAAWGLRTLPMPPET